MKFNRQLHFFFALVAVAVFLTGCGRIEHAFNKSKAKLFSEDPSDIAAITLQTEKNTVQAVTLLSDLYLPWAVVALSQNTLLITEKDGALFRFNVSTSEKEKISGLPASKLWGQGGLMDVLPHPDFKNNGWLYLSYTKEVENKLAVLEVARARLVGSQLEDLEPLFTAEPAVKSGGHFGGALTFDDDEFLYITSGERRSRPLIQQLDNHLGKIIRLHEDGSVPADNPFVASPGAKPEIYTVGHRNPQGIGIEPVSREVWSVEHGPRGGDEINRIEKGLNYGWPVISLGLEYREDKQIGEGTHKAGMEQPLYSFSPSMGTAGMTFYQGDRFPEWKNNLFIAGLALRHLARLEIENGSVVHEERLMEEQDKRVRDVAQGFDGLLYIITDSGELIQLSPASAR